MTYYRRIILNEAGRVGYCSLCDNTAFGLCNRRLRECGR